MTKWILAAGAAALAVTTPALADNHKGGKGNGGGNAKSMKADRGPSMKEARGDRGPSMKADRGPAMKAEKMERGQRGNDRVKVREAKGPKVDAKQRGNGAAGNGGMDEGVRLVERRFDGPFVGRTNVGLGCPPGLDRKDNGCLPPGQAKKLLGAALPAAFDNSMIPYAYRSWYRDNDDYRYRMGDGFIYRVNRDNSLVDGLIPLFGSGYYALGDPWPEPYDFYNVPYQYRSYWADGSNYSYRYGDGAIYRIDPTTQVVSGIVALLAGDLGVGARLPVGYDTYNVPFAYRDRYYDTASDWYRYNDGYIYRVDPTTRLITAVIDAIV